MRTVLTTVASAVLGFLACLVVYFAFRPTDRLLDAPVFPLVRTIVEGSYLLYAAPLLFALGLGLGLFDARRPWLMGLSTMALFVLAAIVEMQRDPTSHNLWPFEFAAYAVFALPAVAGVWVARLVGPRLQRPSGQ
ncbi:MAG: hypothetical protein U1E46_15755 [Hyphomicrobiales bacterium]